jgi:hypothetical protein
LKAGKFIFLLKPWVVGVIHQLGIVMQPTSVTIEPPPIVYYGKLWVGFHDLQTSFAKAGARLQLAETKEAVDHLLKTQNIQFMILNLDLDPEKTRLIIADIRKKRPYIKMLAAGSSLERVVEDNLFCIARDIDGTFTVEQFNNAIETLEKRGSMNAWIMALALLGIAGTWYFAVTSTTPVEKFLGAFWSTVLVFEFVYLLASHKVRFVSN